MTLRRSRNRIPQLGDQLGAYRLTSRIELGGMARIFRAEDTRDQGEVVVKVLAPELAGDPEWVTRFSREARITRFFDHPNIVRIFDIVDTDSAPYPPYMAMELLDGQDLRQRLKETGALDPDVVSQIGQRVARTLAVVHASGVLHRDVKPGNIFLHRREQPLIGELAPFSEFTLKLLDFGVALGLELPNTTRLTGHGLCVGTPDYISPEQVLGREMDERSDVYGLGLVMYELLTGLAPFNSDSPSETLIAQVDTYPEPIAHWRKVPAALEEVVMRCLRKQPDDRFESMAELREALRSC